MNGRVFAEGETMTVFSPHDPENIIPLNFDKSNPLWVKMNKDRFSRDGGDLLLLDARRILDSARRRVNVQHDRRDPSLPDSLGE